MFYNLAISVLVYLFPTRVVAKVIVMLFKKIAKKTKWTTTDDELVAILEERLKEDEK